MKISMDTSVAIHSLKSRIVKIKTEERKRVLRQRGYSGGCMKTRNLVGKTNTVKGHQHGIGGPMHQSNPRSVVFHGVIAMLVYSLVNMSTVAVHSFIPTSLPRKGNGLAFLRILSYK